MSLDDEWQKEKVVQPFNEDNVLREVGNSVQSKYLYSYLLDLKAKIFLIERNYIDKDYLIDFSQFYARSFGINEKYTTRIHFFSESYSHEDILDILSDGTEEKHKKFSDSYLGFTIVKPIKNAYGDYYIGRTLLKTYPQKDDKECRFYLAQHYNISLFGVPLQIQSLPFQAQDSAVGGCATTACWIALHPLNSLFGTEKYSPVEITEMSISFPTLSRNFPSTGLTLFQMKSHFNAIGLETEFIDLTKIQDEKLYKKADDIVADAVKAYNNLGLPVIAAIALMSGKELYGLHAVVISGFRHKLGKVKELYIHDDQIGPFHRVLPQGNFSSWINNWVSSGECSAVIPYKLLIPIYPKLRLNFGNIYHVFLKIKRDTENVTKKLKMKGKLSPELLLVSLNEYKKYLWKRDFNKKTQILRMCLPRFLWIIRINYIYSEISMHIEDFVYDGTSVFPVKLCEIQYG